MFKVKMQGRKIRVIVSWSSGKDSALTLLKLLKDTRYQVVGLFTTYYQDYIPFQATPIELLELQAGRTGIPLITLQLPDIFPENRVYQKLVVEALQQSNLTFDAVAFGDMFCNGIVEYRQSYIQPAGWQCVFPLLGHNTQLLAQEIIQQQIEAFVCTVDTSQLDGKFVGYSYAYELLRQLPAEVDQCGENGEFHTLVTNAPFFSHAVEVELSEVDRKGRFHFQKYKLK